MAARRRNTKCPNCDGPKYKNGFCFNCSPRRVVDPGPDKFIVVLVNKKTGDEREVVRSIKAIGQQCAGTFFKQADVEAGVKVIYCSNTMWTSTAMTD